MYAIGVRCFLPGVTRFNETVKQQKIKIKKPHAKRKRKIVQLVTQCPRLISLLSTPTTSGRHVLVWSPRRKNVSNQRVLSKHDWLRPRPVRVLGILHHKVRGERWPAVNADVIKTGYLVSFPGKLGFMLHCFVAKRRRFQAVFSLLFPRFGTSTLTIMFLLREFIRNKLGSLRFSLNPLL